jgi:hypothetical protein
MMLNNEYFKTARNLLRVAQDIADQTIADRLKTLAEDYERRAEKASHVDATRTPARVVSRAEVAEDRRRQRLSRE